MGASGPGAGTAGKGGGEAEPEERKRSELAAILGGLPHTEPGTFCMDVALDAICGLKKLDYSVTELHYTASGLQFTTDPKFDKNNRYLITITPV